MADTIGDRTLGINDQARALLEYLGDMEPSFADYIKGGWYDVRLQTRPWYNGREHGFVVSMQCGLAGYGPAIHIAAFEHRNSDQICTLVWETSSFYWDGPVADDETLALAYHGGDKSAVAQSFEYGNIGAAVTWIYDTLAEFYAMHRVHTAVAEEA